MTCSIFLNISCAACVTAAIVISGCTQNIREQSPNTIAGSVKHVSRPDQPELAWFAPKLHISHYRTLFYGYDTVDYRLAAPEHPENDVNRVFRLLVDGNLRHYDFAKMPDASTRDVIHE